MADCPVAKESWSKSAKGVSAIFSALLLFPSCAPEVRQLAGHTMGTTWHATLVMPPSVHLSQDEWQTLLQSRLDALDLAFTNWRPDAPVSRFNASRETGWQGVSRELVDLVRFAGELSEKTGGAFDITVAPLVDLWGFGPKGRVTEPPGDAAIAAAMAHVGWRRIELRQDPPALRKLDPEVEINVSAMADGYACDDLARLLRGRSVENFLVEIGGAVIARGKNARGEAWRVGIQQPGRVAGATVVSLPLRSGAVSTAGLYRQFFEHDGHRYAHVLDARTGRPVAHDLVSVSVQHDSAFAADGWDTALLVLGPVEGRKLAEKLALDAMFLKQ